jgi:hypothetical protein
MHSILISNIILFSIFYTTYANFCVPAHTHNTEFR